ncbi:hypothetical protein ACIBQ1_37665 [Nonomuraea sp. NPDC050153]|uniref:hypothetical protein n=1 Tax=Nonomuraea sp. NPDC050153 TaxID=3364359 RepID=UPI0037AF7E25
MYPAWDEVVDDLDGDEGRIVQAALYASPARVAHPDIVRGAAYAWTRRCGGPV